MTESQTQTPDPARTSVTITRLGLRGDGVAEGPLYAPLTLPGERVSGRPEGDRLTEIRIEEPVPDRVAPPCRHFKRCGGCQLQHGSDAFVAAWKTEVVAQALAAQGLEAEMKPILTSPPQSRRRATLSARRGKKGATAGFHARASGVIVEIPDCKLLDPALLAAREMVAELAMLGGSRKGEVQAALTLSEAGLDVAVRGGKPLDGALRLALAELAQRHDLARIAWEDEVIATRRPPLQAMGRARVTPPPGAFLQATAQGQADLTQAVRDALGPLRGNARVLDLFAGCGTFALPLAEAAEVHAVEGAGEMLHALDAGWRHAQGLRRVTTEARDLFRNPLIAEELHGYAAAVLDPPRAGAAAQVAQLADAGPARLAYVSCNPATFARDAAVLVAGGYRLDWVQVVDQFRWSAHVELAAAFTRTHMPG